MYDTANKVRELKHRLESFSLFFSSDLCVGLNVSSVEFMTPLLQSQSAQNDLLIFSHYGGMNVCQCSVFHLFVLAIKVRNQIAPISHV